MMSNVSQLVNAWWYLGKKTYRGRCLFFSLLLRLGIPFYQNPFNLDIAKHGQAILGDRLLALQAGNEPDLYGKHGHRDPVRLAGSLLSRSLTNVFQSYAPANYAQEFGSLVAQTANNSDVVRKNDLWLVASTSTGEYNTNIWSPSAIWGTGIIDQYSQNIHALTVQRCVLCFTLRLICSCSQVSRQQLRCSIWYRGTNQTSGRLRRVPLARTRRLDRVAVPRVLPGSDRTRQAAPDVRDELCVLLWLPWYF